VRRWRVLLACSLALGAPDAGARGLDPQKALTQYNLDTWTTEKGLPQNTVTAIVQTSDGYLWVGSFGGLARFDGARFVSFDRSNLPALRNSGIQSLWPARSGGLWIGTNGGGLTFLKDGAARTHTTADGLAGDVVRALFEDRAGRLWIGTNGGLSLLENGRIRSWTAKEGFTNNVVRAIREDKEGALWIGTNGDGLHRMKDGAFQRFGKKDGLPNDFIFSLHADDDGSVYVGTNGGSLARIQDGRVRVFGPADGLPGDIIWSLQQDVDGRLWVGTYGAGLFRRKGDSFERLSTASGLSNDFVRALWQDHEGSLWIGTNGGGLARLRDGKFTTYTTREGLPSDITKTVLADRSGGLWIGTSGGGLARFADGRFTSYTRKDGLPNDFVQSLLEDKDGALWIGTNGGGIARFAKGVFRVYTVKDGLADDHVAAMAEDRQGALWIGTNAGGLSRFHDGRFTTFTKKDGLGASLILTTLVDKDDAVWVGTDGGGLTRIVKGRLETFTSAQGLAADSVLSLYQDSAGLLWVGTSGGGLSLYKDGRFSSLSSKDGLRDDVVFAILSDGGDGLWLSGNKGISRVSRRALLARAAGGADLLAPVAFGVADGMKSNECSGVSQPAATRLGDGRLVFPTTRGIVMIDPQRIPRNDIPPPVRFEELIASSGRRFTGDAIELPAGTNNFEIDFTALSLLAPERVRFQYRLAGLDEDWTAAEGRRQAYYTQTPPGSYVFEVKASNNDGVWNEQGARTRITLRPRFRETRAFLALVALSLVLLGAGANALRARGQETRRRELERLVEERTHALREQQEHAEAARQEAERQRATAERLREVAQRANMVKTDVLSIAAHDLKNPLQLVLGHAEMAQMRLSEGKSVGEFVGHIHAAAQRMLGILGALLDTAALDAGKISLKQERVDLAEVARHVVETSRAAAAKKGQEIAFTAEHDLFVSGDEERLGEVIENLVSNAIKYSPFWLKIEVAARRDGGRVLVSVADSGPGLTRLDKEKIFGRFQRLSARPTGGESSTGLGLAIARQLAELMGGELGAVSEGPGTGSRFTLSLPAAS